MAERAADKRPRRHNEVLRELAVLLREPGRTLEQDLEALSRAAAEFLCVARASVWLFDEARTVLECATQYDREANRHSSGQRLVAEQVPTYFAACVDVQALAVADVRVDSRVAELAEHLSGAGIKAMLDAPIFVGAAALGVVRHEDTRVRPWAEEETAFAASIAQLAANSVAATRWRARELALRKSEARYRSMVEDFSDFVVRTAPNGKIIEVNSAAAIAPGIDLADFPNLTVYDMVPAEERHIFVDAVRRCTPESPVVHYSHHVLARDGPWLAVDWTARAFFDEDGVVTSYQSIGRDVTEERRQQATLQEAQRLEALALFSGGIAHDLNNVLTPILMLSEAAVVSLPAELEEIEDLREISKAALRARALVRQVLMFARPSDGAQREVIDPAVYVIEAAGFIRATAQPSISHDVQVAEDCGAVRAAPTDLFQVVSNLCVNAIQAMPSGGQLRVVAAAEDGWFRLEVSDTGEGIPRDVAQRVFDPFFTTKPLGKGTGLGLSVIRSLVEHLGGSIRFESTVGKGTRFIVLLPQVEAEAGQGEVQPSSEGLGGTEHVLLVDDEPGVLRSLAIGLSLLGYEVTCEARPHGALALLEDTDFDIVVTDQTMPEMSGVELAAAIAVLRPNLPVVLMSGGEIDGDAASSVRATLSKPLRIPELAACVRSVLG
ncbi:MAG: response regulator [Nannocystaceae bacterium]|nr:response regulator [Nannocystaceae bacterium]